MLYIFGYILLSLVAAKLFLASHSAVVIWFFIVAWFIGWFLMLGLLLTHDSKNAPGMTLAKRLGEGLEMLKEWLWFMGVLAAIGLVLALLG